MSDISALLGNEDRDVAQLEAELHEKRSSIAQQEERVSQFNRYFSMKFSPCFGGINI